jgi:hypothetical protein
MLLRNLPTLLTDELKVSPTNLKLGVEARLEGKRELGGVATGLGLGLGLGLGVLGGVGTGLKVLLRNLPTLLTDELKVLLRNLPTLLTDELRKFPASDKMLGVGAVLVVDIFLTLRLLAAKKAGVARAVTNPVISPPLTEADSNPLGLLMLCLLVVNRPCAYMPVAAIAPAAAPIPTLLNNDPSISLRLFVSALNDLGVDLLEVELLLGVLEGVGANLKMSPTNLLKLLKAGLTREKKLWVEARLEVKPELRGVATGLGPGLGLGAGVEAVLGVCRCLTLW